MKPPCLPSSLWHVQCGICIVNYVVNGLLMWLIYRRTSKELRIYGRILLCICWFDMAYTTASLLIDTRNSFRNGFYVVVVNGPLGHISESLAWNILAIMAQTYVFCLMTVILSVPFIYRYFVICRGRVLTTTQFTTLVVAVCAVPLVYPLNYAIFIWPSAARILESEKAALENATCQDPGQVALYKENERQSYVGISGKFITMFMLCASYVIILFTSCAIFVRSRRKALSQRVNVANKQLTYVLTLQALTPFIFFVLPLASTYMTMWFALDVGQYIGILLSYGYAVFPSISASYTILFVRKYRRTVLGFLQFNASVSQTGARSSS